jgi:uncharacterized protein (DUF1778 family)
MARHKNETLSIRTSAEVKQLLKQAAEREHRSVASMMEVLVLEYAERHELRAHARATPPA